MNGDIVVPAGYCGFTVVPVVTTVELVGGAVGPVGCRHC